MKNKMTENKGPRKPNGFKRRKLMAEKTAANGYMKVNSTNTRFLGRSAMEAVTSEATELEAQMQVRKRA
ncbi:uncharacterized protein G2W53_031030 [Senna tora]|uniref:Uncharacterized protein n=1 Tax=Senna tora TaxID=362788 RepID=A0A834T8I3_9FABA|nr:uncharacterized protein G2W53_031030 [Senna tora]